MKLGNLLAVGLGAVGIACGASSVTAPGTTALTGIAPAANAVGVDVADQVVLTFSGPMMTSMDSMIALHDGDLSGAEVPGHFMWSGGGDSLFFMPDSALMAGHHYTVHVGGGMLDAAGDTVDFQFAHDSLGCAWATGQMMGGGMMGGRGEMGHGWQGSNGNYGMAWGFSTSS